MKRKILKVFILSVIFMTLCNYAKAFEFDTTLSPDEVVYKSSSARINIINPTVQNNQTGGSYPGYRGANQLIIYTPDYVNKKTGTNEFGTEAIVVNGYVTSLSGADSIIPHNGFVISGHGRAKTWINQNVTIGSKIIVNPETKIITSALTPESLLFAANEKIKEVYSIMRYYAHQNIPYDYSNAADYLKKSQKALNQAIKHKDNIQKNATTAIENANSAINYSIPYYRNELKGIWIRPVEKSQAEIINTLDKIKNAGIDTIFLETYYHAKTIYPSEVLSKYNITNQRQEFVGFDPFQIWITEAHKRNIKVYAWFECFYVGNDNPAINPNHILSVYPQWANTTKLKYDSSTLVYSVNEHNGYFLDPANPMVQEYLLEVLNELITKYHPDGINLDYIRYPQTVEKRSSNYENGNWGYTQFARDEFKEIYNIDPIEIQKNTQEWDWWAKYRQNKVSDFVRKVGQITKNNKLKLTAVIFPDRQKSLDTKMQDWKTWSTRGYVDGFTPLLLSCDYETAKGLLQDIKNNSSKYTDIYAGLFVSFMNGTTDDMLRQIHMSRQLKAKGIIIFEYSHFTKKYIEAVTASAFTPLSDKSIKKLQSSELSQKKLQTFLDKSIKDFYSQEALFNHMLSKKHKKHSKQNEIIETNDIKNKPSIQTKDDNTEIKNSANKHNKKKRNPEKFAPDKEQGNQGRFY